MNTRLPDRAGRLSLIERMLFRNASGLRAVEIAQACGVDRRTIYRDLATLERNGVPIAEENGRFFINRDYYAATVRVNVNEAVALYTALRILTRHANPQNPHLISALTRLAAAVPEPIAVHVNYLADMLRASPIDRNFVQVLEIVIRGWVERTRVRMWVADADHRTAEISVREFATYFIEPAADGGLYLIGWDDAMGVRTLRLETVRRAKLLDQHYEVPANFDRRSWLETAWGTIGEGSGSQKVTLAFPPDLIPLIKERIWHPAQPIEILNDRRCTLTLRVNDWRDLLSWVRSWGTQVEVLEPAAMREALGLEAARLLSLYMAART
jgi:predicted DNA-binding transcriptional regulator YafY